MASSETCFIDHQPASAAAPTRVKTRNRFRAENSMIRLIMAQRGPAESHTAFGIQEEVPGNHNSLSGLETLGDLDGVSHAPAGFDRTGSKGAVRSLHIYRFAKAGINDGIHRHGDALWKRYLKLDIHKHIGPQQICRIIHFEPDLQSTGHGIELWERVADPRGKLPILIADGSASRHTQQPCVVLED